MSTKFPGGIISKTAPVPSGSFENSTAPGIWTLEQQAYWQKLGQWPIPGSVQPDPQFNYVTMLLHGDGTNGAQNNTFIDSSTNAFSITRGGNTTQGSFGPFGSNWSNAFDGTGDRLFIADVTNLGFGTGDFTVELWANFNGSALDYGFVGSVNNGGMDFVYHSTGSLRIGRVGVAWDSIFSPFTPVIGTWYHIAFTRSGSTARAFVNGVQIGSNSTNTISYDPSGGMNIGASNSTGARHLDGYMSNLRMLKGTALYTANFTPPTAPLTAITNTSVLTCQNNYFKDNSTNNSAITVFGDTSVQRFSPFAVSTAYSTSVIGGSGYFGSASDYLTAPSNAVFAFGTGDFTVEGWFYQTDPTPTYTAALEIGDHASTTGILFIAESGDIAQIYSGGFFGGTAVTQRAWNHIAWVRSSGVLYVYVNGVSPAGVAFTNNLTGTSTVTIANKSAPAAGYAFIGNMNGLRVVKGTAVYTANFTPPTAPLTAISGTSLLLNYTNGAIFDNAMMNDLETAGNAQISTSVVKYGTGSMAFDGTGDYLQARSIPSNGLGAGDFTIEMWVYMNNTTGTQDFYADGTDGNGPALYSDAGTLKWYYSSVYSSGGTISAGAWTHIAACRASGTLRFFIDGVVTPTSHSLSTDYPAKILRIGSSYYSEAMNGYIDDLRVTKGYARYTTNFTPPTSAFPNIGPT